MANYVKIKRFHCSRKQTFRGKVLDSTIIGHKFVALSAKVCGIIRKFCQQNLLSEKVWGNVLKSFRYCVSKTTGRWRYFFFWKSKTNKTAHFFWQQKLSCVKLSLKEEHSCVFLKCSASIDELVTRSYPHKGTAKFGITSKLITQMSYRWEHFRVGFLIFGNIFMYHSLNELLLLLLYTRWLILF